ncbi:MAG TPA: SDR family NAD(P)-dependent oxidoreductase [Gaiellaceae bacterium]|nr:SDR family NAD(P)-dependent oxidoreductase [Gaiellaceae bacterium]
MSRLAGRVALVTGAGRGIGRATAVRLAADGAAVALVARGTDDIESLAAEVHAAGGDALALAADVTDADAVERAVERTLAELGRLDVLVTCAAAPAASGPTEELPLEQWRALVDTDLTGVFVTCRAAARPMLAQGFGRVVNLTSFHVVATYPQRAAYVAAKAGVVGLTQALAVEWGGRGITVNAVAPGPIRTARTSWFIEHDPHAGPGMIGRTPTGRLGEPEEVADVVSFLAGDDARHVTGQMIVVDGGWTRNAWWGPHPFTG